MNFLEKYKKEFEEYDKLDHDFIDDEKIWAQLNKWENPSREDVRRVLKKAEQCVRLEPEETAILLQNRDESTMQEMYELAHKLKEEVYGDRIVFFAPLYISDECANNCKYCGFRSSNLSYLSQRQPNSKIYCRLGICFSIFHNAGCISGQNIQG